MGQNIYMLPSDINLKIKTGTVGYNNKILISDENFILGKNVEVNAGLAKPEEEALGPHYMETTKKDLQKPATIHKLITQKPIITHEEERAALILFLTGGFTIWFMFR